MILKRPNINLYDSERFISLPYENVVFLISEDFVEGTLAVHKFDLKLNDWNWDKKNTVNFLDKEVPYLPFDLVADLFAIKLEETLGLRNKNLPPKKVVYTYVKTVLVLKGFEKSLVTSMDCCVVPAKDCKLTPLKGLPQKILEKLGIETCCSINEKIGIFINPFKFLSVVEKNIQEADRA